MAKNAKTGLAVLKKRKSQIGVEFFLVLSVIVAFVVILYGTATREIGKTRALNDAILSKTAVDSLGDAVDFVFLSGEGSNLTRDLFVSQNSNCFYHSSKNPGQGTNSLNPNRLYCTISSEHLQELTGGKEQVYSKTLLLPQSALVLDASCSPLTGGWVSASIAKTNGVVNVVCVKNP